MTCADDSTLGLRAVTGSRTPDHRGQRFAQAALADIAAMADRLRLDLRLRVEPITGDDDTCLLELID
ncbi:hypothetical protein ACFYTC_01470 [Actinomadura nitritigenes]|uniref:hypothetical protein n=1 Tax=Actinomadura nitritigenes TaxID=134602 RepID=UPI00369D25F6